MGAIGIGIGALNFDLAIQILTFIWLICDLYLNIHVLESCEIGAWHHLTWLSLHPSQSPQLINPYLHVHLGYPWGEVLNFIPHRSPKPPKHG